MAPVKSFALMSNAVSFQLDILSQYSATSIQVFNYIINQVIL